MPGTLMFDAALKWDVLKNEQDFSALIVRYQKLLDNLKIKLSDKNLGLDKGSVEKLFEDVSKGVGDQITQKIKDALKNNQPIEASFFTGLSKNVAESISRGINAGARNSGDVKLKAMVDTQSTSPIIMQFRDALKNTHDTLRGAFKDRPAAQTWDKKPNYDPNTNRQLMDVRVVNRGSDPIPIDFVKTSNEVSSMLASHFNLLQHTIEAGLTSVSTSIMQNGGGGGGNDQPTKTAPVLNAERNIIDFLREALPDPRQPNNPAQYYGGDLTHTRLADVIKDLRDQIKRIDRAALGGTDKAQYSQIEGTLNTYFTELNSALERQQRLRERYQEDYENGVSDPNKTVEQTYVDRLGDVETATRQIFDRFVQGHGDYLQQLTRIPEQLNELSSKTRKSADAFGGGMMGMLRDLQMIGIQVPPELQRVISLGETFHSLVQKYVPENIMSSAFVRRGFMGNVQHTGHLFGRTAFRGVTGGLMNLGVSPEVARSVGGLARSAGGFLGNIMGIGGGAVAGMAGSVPILGTVAALGMIAKGWWDTTKENRKKEREQALKDEQYFQSLRLKGIEHANKLEMSHLEAVAEREKTRLKNQSELNRMRMEMNTADLETQQKLYEIDLLRAKGQEGMNRLKQVTSFSSESLEAAWSHQTQLQDKRTEGKLVNGIQHLWGIFGWNPGYDGSGNALNSSVTSAATSGHLGELEDVAVTNILQAGKRSWEMSTAEIKKWIEMEMKVEQTAVDALASMEGTISETSRKQIEATLKSSETIRNNMLETKRLDELAFGRMLLNFKNYGVGGVKYNEVQYDPDTREFVTRLGNGETAVLGKAEDLFNALSKLLNSADGRKAMQAVEAEQKRLEAQQRKLLLEVEQAKVESTLSDAYMQHIKKIEELKKALREDLFKHIVASAQELSKWNTSNEDKLHSMKMWGEEAIQKFQLNDPRYLNNANAKQNLEIKQSLEKQMYELVGSVEKDATKWFNVYGDTANRGDIGSVQARQAQERWEQIRIKREDSHFQLQTSQAEALFSLEMENINKRNTAEIEGINKQTELSIKMATTVLEQWKAVLDPYGKNLFDIQKQLDLAEIELKYAKEISESEQKFQKDLADWEIQQNEIILRAQQEAEEKDFDAVAAREEEILKKKHQLEIQLLEIEFQLRLKQIEYEVQYRAQLIKQQQKMEETTGSAFVSNVRNDKGQEIFTLKEIAQLRGKEVSELTDEDKKFTTEDLRTMRVNRSVNYQTSLDTMRELAKQSGVTVRLEDEESVFGDNLDVGIEDFIKRKKQSFLSENKEAYESGTLKGSDKILYEGLLKETTDPELLTADLDTQSLVKAFTGKLVRDFGELATEGGTKMFNSAQQEEVQKKYDTLTGAENPELRRKEQDIQALNRDIADLRADINREGYSNSTLALMKKYNIAIPDSQTTPVTADQILRTLEDKIMPKMVSEANEMRKKDSDAVAGYGGQLVTLEQQGKNFGTLLSDVLRFSPDVGMKSVEGVMQASQEAQEENNELTAKAVDLLQNGEFTVHDPETGEEVKMGVMDASKMLAEQTAEGQREVKRMEMERKQARERDKTVAKAEQEKEKAEKTNQQKEDIAAKERDKEKAKAEQEAYLNALQRQSQFNADMIKIEGQRGSSQLQTDTAAAIELLQVKDGTAWMKAIMKRNQETMFNQQTAYLAEKHRIEMEEYKSRGNVTEEGMAELEVQQQTERDQLQSAKQIGDAVRDSLNGVGALRSLVTEGTGSKVGLTEGWEKIQAAAFGHVIDPTADAITQLNKMSQLQHASLMNLLTQSLPAMVTNTANMKPSAFANMIRGLTQPQVNNNFYEGGGLAED